MRERSLESDMKVMLEGREGKEGREERRRE